MKNEKVQVQFTLVDGRRIVLSMNLLIARDSHVDCRELVKNVRVGYPVGWLIIKDHSHQKTVFNLSGVVPYAIIDHRSNEANSYVLSENLADPPVKAEMSGSLFVFVNMMTFITLQEIRAIDIEKKWMAMLGPLIEKHKSERRGYHDRASGSDRNETVRNSEKDEALVKSEEIKILEKRIFSFKKARFYNKHIEEMVQELTPIIEKLEGRLKELMNS